MMGCHPHDYVMLQKALTSWQYSMDYFPGFEEASCHNEGCLYGYNEKNQELY